MTSIAILLTCNDESDFARRFPDDAECFKRILRPQRPHWHFETVPVFQDVFPESAGSYDGYVITGSPASVHDPDPWIRRLMNLIREINDLRMPLVGCCFGHQAIAVALGGEVSRNAFGWAFGVAETRFSVREKWMNPFSRSIGLYAAHSEQVSKLPPGARVLGGNDRCPFAAFAVDSHIMATGYHPEMTQEFLRALVLHLEPRLERDVVESALSQLNDEAEGEIFAGWMANFLENAVSHADEGRAAA